MDIWSPYSPHRRISWRARLSSNMGDLRFDLDDFEWSNSTNWLISWEWWEIRPWTQWAAYIKSHASFQMRSWHLTLDDLEGSKSINWLISREWWEIMPWTQWATYIKSHVSFQMRSWPWRVKIHKLTHLGNGDRAMNSMGNIYTVTSELSNEVMTFDLGWPWRVKVHKVAHISGIVYP